MNRQTIMEIDTNAFKYNVNLIKEIAGENIEIMPVIKANGYGTYVNKKIDLIRDFSIVATAIVDEAIELRNVGFRNEIFVLNEPAAEDIENILEYNVSVGVCDINFIENLAKRAMEQNKKAVVHLEIETGMGRTGVFVKDLDYFLNRLEEINNTYNNSIVVEGIYTHFSVADSKDENNIDYTKNQIRIIEEATKIIKERINTIKYVHCSASSGLLNYINKEEENNNEDRKIFNLVRPGIILYGYEPYEGAFKYTLKNEERTYNFKPISKLKTKIVYLKEVDENQSISYGRKFISDKKMKIATIGIGYADGYRRSFTNKGKVFINGMVCNVIGTVCMDSCMVDVTELGDNVHVGDVVYIWDNENVKLEDLANIDNTINYEIISCISDRVRREFV